MKSTTFHQWQFLELIEEFKHTHHYSGIHKTRKVQPQSDDEGEVNSQVVDESRIGKDVWKVDRVGRHEEPRAEGSEVIAAADCYRGVGSLYL